nr:MAG TPA: hypothetical protein [Caudoviricetes sp.]
MGRFYTIRYLIVKTFQTKTQLFHNFFDFPKRLGT